MKIFAIKEDSNNKKEIGYLFYYEKTKDFYIELLDGLSEWDIPLILSSLYKKGIRTVDSYWSKLWVQQRIVPIDRQNIGQLLRDNKLKKYDEFSILALSRGKCAQDNYYLSPMTEKELPNEIIKRFDYRVSNVMSLGNGLLFVLFRNNAIKIFDIKKHIKRNKKFDYILKNNYIDEAKVLVGGYGIYWDKNFVISDLELYNQGSDVKIDGSILTQYIKNNILTTQEVMNELNCSRQYVNELVKSNKLKSLKSSEKNTIFLKSDVLNYSFE